VRRGAAWPPASDRAADGRGGGRPVLARGAPVVLVRWAVRGGCSPTRRLPGGASSRHPASGVVAVVDNPRTPAVASVAGPRPPCGVRPSGFVVRDPAVQPSGVQPVRCPVTRVRRQGSGGPDGRCPPVRCPAAWCPAAWCPAAWRPAAWRPPRPSGRVRPVHLRRWRWGPGRCGGAPCTTGTGRGRGGRPRRRAARASVSGVGGGPGPGGVRAGGCGACPLPDQAGQAGVGSAVAGG
jgi:hypothetical protein